MFGTEGPFAYRQRALKQRNRLGRRTLLAKLREQIGECLFAFADDGDVDRRMVEHPGGVAGDFRAAENDQQIRSMSFQPLGDPECAVDVPEVAGKADDVGILGEDGVNESEIGIGIRNARRKEGGSSKSRSSEARRWARVECNS